jgi:hypothetical protein
LPYCPSAAVKLSVPFQDTSPIQLALFDRTPVFEHV